MSTKSQGKSAQKKRNDRSFIAIVGVLLLIGAGVIGYVVSRPKAAAVELDPNAPLPAPKGIVAGSATAPVEIMEFADFECPGCQRFATVTEPDVRRLLVNTGLARFQFIDHPLPSIHPATMVAHNAAACAASMGKFWEMHDRIYFGQTEWSTFANGRDMNAPKIMKRYAKELGLDAKPFAECLDARKFEPQVLANLKEGKRLGVGSTPSFIVGKRLVAGATYDDIKALVDSATADAKKASADSGKKAPTAKGN